MEKHLWVWKRISQGLLCYVLGWLTGIVFLVLEKENKFVLMFKAYQGEMYKLPIVGDFAEAQTK